MNKVLCLSLFFGMIVATAVPAYASTIAEATFRFVDEDGRPMAGLALYYHFEGGAERNVKTDTNGMCVLKGRTDTGVLNCCTRKREGFYRSGIQYKFEGGITNGYWQPCNPVVTMVVRRIVNPIPMYVKRAATHIPRKNEWFGYDLKVGDWVQPVGKGCVSDLVFRVQGYWHNYRDNDSTVAVTFAQQMDGLFATKHEIYPGGDVGCEFVMPRESPLDGFSNKFEWRQSRKARKDGVLPDTILNEMDIEGRDYIFRIRSMTNEIGIVTNAFYGKIRGNIEFVGSAEDNRGGWLRFLYYLNPTPNDRNLEFDPNRNLFIKLKPTELVGDP